MWSDYAEMARVFPWLLPTAAAVFGAMVGSFLNVVIARVPAGRSIVRPGSQCACGQPIAWYDNVPVFSWFLLRGRARCCGRPYSFRYPLVELLTAGLFLTCWLLFPPAKALIGMGFVSVLICATFIDLDHLIIPDVFTIGAAIVGVLLSGLVPSLHGFGEELAPVGSLRAGLASLQGVLIGSGLVLWIALLAETVLKKEAMGFGDVKFVGAIGAFCGWPGAVFAVFGGAVVGTIWLAVALTWRRITGRTSPVAPRAETPDGEPAELGFGVQVPFGPMLAIAGGIYFLWAHVWLREYLADLAVLFS